MDEFRAPFFWLAVLALGLGILVELGSVGMLHGLAPAAVKVDAPGWGLRYLAIIDFILAYGVITIGLGQLPIRGLVGRIQGPVALVLSFLGCLASIVLALAALGMLALMLALFVAVPFGTLAYLAIWGSFPTGTAQTALALVMFLKLAFCVLLLLAQQRFLTNKGLIVLTGLSLGATWVVSFLVGFPPSILASIADVIGALVIAIVGAIWLLLLCISSLLNLLSVVRSVRVPTSA